MGDFCPNKKESSLEFRNFWKKKHFFEHVFLKVFVRRQRMESRQTCTKKFVKRLQIFLSESRNVQILHSESKNVREIGMYSEKNVPSKKASRPVESQLVNTEKNFSHREEKVSLFANVKINFGPIPKKVSNITFSLKKNLLLIVSLLTVRKLICQNATSFSLRLHKRQWKNLNYFLRRIFPQNSRKFFCEKSTKVSFKLRNVRNANFLYCVPFYQNNPPDTQKATPTTNFKKNIVKKPRFIQSICKYQRNFKTFQKVILSKWFHGHADCKFVKPDRKISPTSINSLKSKISIFFS